MEMEAMDVVMEGRGSEAGAAAEVAGREGQKGQKYDAPRVRATTMTYGRKHSFVYGEKKTEADVSTPRAAEVRSAAAYRGAWRGVCGGAAPVGAAPARAVWRGDGTGGVRHSRQHGTVGARGRHSAAAA